MSSCVLRASGRRFSAKRYLATSTFIAETITDNSFEFVVSQCAAEDFPGQVADALRFLTAKQLNLARLLGFPGVERVTLVFRVRAAAATPLALPVPLSRELSRHGLECELVVATG